MVDITTNLNLASHKLRQGQTVFCTRKQISINSKCL